MSGLRTRPPLLQTAPRLNRSQRDALKAKIKDLNPWYHNMNLGKGIWTHSESAGSGSNYPASRFQLLRPLLPDVAGKDCLDIGCSSGFFSLKLKELGARYVVGVDDGEQVRAIDQARLAASTLNLEVEFRTMSAYDVHQLQRQFDLVLFLGVLYHLRHPMLALESIRKVCAGTLLFQTITTPHEPGTYESCPTPEHVDSGLRAAELSQPTFPNLRFVEGSLDGDTTCWFIPSVEAVLAMLRATGFRPKQMIRPDGHEVIVQAEAV